MAEVTILVVDDVKIIRRLVRVNLELEGYSVVEAENGKDALDKVKETKPDLILLDVIMPYLDGFQVLQRLRANTETKDVPVVMLTSCSEEIDQIKGWELGISDYVIKPFNPNALVTVVKKALSEISGQKTKKKRDAEIAKLKIVKTIKNVDEDIF